MATMLRQWRLRAATGVASIALVGMVAVMVALMLAGGTAAMAAVPPPAVASGASVEASRVRADVQDFAFESMHADYTLGRADDGTSTLRVVETFVAVFPEADQNRGMQRLIPDSYLGVPLHPVLVSVTDEVGAARPVETENVEGGLRVTSRSDDFVHGAQTYVFTYELVNVTRYFADTNVDEFYWNVTGFDWEQVLGEVTATLNVSSELAPALTGAVACYWGPRGATDRCVISMPTAGPGGSSSITAEATRLGQGEGMTIAVGFEAGTFVPFSEPPWSWLQVIAAALGLGGLAAAIRARATRLRDARGRPSIIAEYEPPADIDALEAAVLLQEPSRAIAAEVLEQAVAGSIRIVQGPPKWWGGAGPFELHLVDASRADPNGRVLLAGLFDAFEGSAARTVFVMGSRDARVSRTAMSILRAAGQEIVRKGLHAVVPPRDRLLPIVLAVFGAVGALVAAIAGPNAALSIGGIVLGAVLLVASIVLIARTPLTSHGAEVRDHLLGLKMFIEWAEADRIGMLQSPEGAERVAIAADDPRQIVKLYEKLLPYAVVFGQEDEWAKQLAFYYGSEQPSWYFGSTAFNAAAFSSSITSLTTSSSSSTSGGSSGGGFSGGGGGGGGGGGV